MRTRTLGDTELTFPEVTLGTWGLATNAYGPSTEGALEAVVERALELGVDAFDLAPLWGRGEAERVVGRVVGARRDRVRYVSRAGVALEDGALVRRYDPDSLERDLDGSLERLGTAKLDVLLLHNPPEEALRAPGWSECLEKLREEGRIAAWGAAIDDVAGGRLALARGAKALGVPYHLLGPELGDELAAETTLAGAGLFPRSVLAHGLLGGSLDTRKLSAGDHRRDRWKRDVFASRLAHAGAMRFLVQDDVPDLAVAALRFALAKKAAASIVIGPRTIAQLEHLVSNVGEPPFLPETAGPRVQQVLAVLGL